MLRITEARKRKTKCAHKKQENKKELKFKINSKLENIVG